MAAANPTADPQPPKPSSISRFTIGVEIVFLVLAAGFGAWLRLSHIAARSLWVDEGSSVAIARLDWWNFFRLLWRREANMSLYYLLLRGWLHFGASEAWVRGLSALFGVLAIPAIYSMARRMWGVATAVMAAALLTVNAYHIRYSDEARGYSLAVLLVTVSCWSLVEFVKKNTKQARWIYAVSSVLAVYAHFYSLLVLVAQWIYLRSLKLQGKQSHEMRAAVRVTLIGIAPIFVFLLTTGAGPLAWLPRPGWRMLWEFALYLSGGGAAVFAVYAVCVLCGFLLRGKAEQTLQKWLRLAALWLVLPVVLTFVLSWIKPVFLPRFLIVTLPAWCLLAAIGIAKMRPRLIGAAAGVLLVALSVPTIEHLYAAGLDQPNEDWRNATAYVLHRSQATDGAIFYSSQCRLPFDFYAGGAANGPRVIFPAHGDKLTYLDFMGRPSEEQLANIHQEIARLWLVMCHNELPGSGYDAATRNLRISLQSQYQLTSSASFPGVEVEEYVAPDANQR